MNFVAPVRPGDTVHAEVVVKEIMRGRCRAVLQTTCRVRDQVVVDGEATVKLTSSAKRAAKAA
jgi:3-hydroxybutyryl-CoA dehydratase